MNAQRLIENFLCRARVDTHYTLLFADIVAVVAAGVFGDDLGGENRLVGLYIAYTLDALACGGTYAFEHFIRRIADGMIPRPRVLDGRDGDIAAEIPRLLACGFVSRDHNERDVVKSAEDGVVSDLAGKPTVDRVVIPTARRLGVIEKCALCSGHCVRSDDHKCINDVELVSLNVA